MKTVSLQQAFNLIAQENFDKYGIRVINTEYSNELYGVGDTLPHSYRWDDDGSTGIDLHGTSALAVNPLSLEKRFKILIREYGVLGNQVVLLGSNDWMWGEDENEIEMKNAVVLYVFDA